MRYFAHTTDIWYSFDLNPVFVAILDRACAVVSDREAKEWSWLYNISTKFASYPLQGGQHRGENSSLSKHLHSIFTHRQYPPAPVATNIHEMKRTYDDADENTTKHHGSRLRNLSPW
jgi:hypothetical protein